MHILVLDIIHGGKEIGAGYTNAGHTADVVDVYTGTTPDLLMRAKTRAYDLIVSPVHLDPDHALLARRNIPVITHHEAVRQLLGENLPYPMIEITGARGKTTTAFALAHVLLGKGVLHTSTGTYSYPGKTLLWKRSITPASVIPAVRYAGRMRGWLVAEISLGVTGTGDLAIITSPEDYTFAGGKKFALAEKTASARHAKQLLVAQDISMDQENVVHVNDIARCDGMQCTLEWKGMKFVLKNPLFNLPPYRAPLMLAGAAAMILHVNPLPLSSFTALPGRMSVSHEGNRMVVDNANSGTNVTTTMCAARYARSCAQRRELTLVIGQVEGDGAVCEGFSFDQIAYAIGKVEPNHLVWVGRFPNPGSDLYDELKGKIDAFCTTLEEARNTALQIAGEGSIILSVKTWR
jgi:UDP-N-acetylmuramyl pentapeptide synthase